MRPTLTLLALFLVACDTSTDPDKTDPVDTGVDDTGNPVTATAEVRVMHLSPDAPAVDVFVDGIADAVVSDLAFGSGSTWVEVPVGTYTFRVAPAGAGVEAAVLTIADLTLGEDTRSTAVAYDYVANLTAKALADDVTGMEAGNFRVNVMHGAPGVGEVDIWALTDSGAVPLLENVPFGANAPLDLPAGTYTVGLDVDNDANPDVVFSLPELTAGLYVNLYATNDVNGNVYLLAQLPDGAVAQIDPDMVPPPANAELRVLHLSPDAPAVDVYVDGLAEPVVSGLAFGEGTGYLEVPAGTYTVRVTPAGSGPEDAVLVVAGLELAANGAYTAVALDTVAEIGALALFDDNEGIAAGSFRAQVVHAASGVGQVDIWEVSGEPTPLFVDFDFGASVVADLPTSAYNLGVDVDNDAIPDLTFGIPALPDGSFSNVYAVNDSEGAVYLLAQLEDGTLVQIDPS